MSRIIKEVKGHPQRIEFRLNQTIYTLDVERICSFAVSSTGTLDRRVELEMICSSVEMKPCNSDFMEDVKALAKQYGYELAKIEVNRSYEKEKSEIKA